MLIREIIIIVFVFRVRSYHKVELFHTAYANPWRLARRSRRQRSVFPWNSACGYSPVENLELRPLSIQLERETAIFKDNLMAMQNVENATFVDIQHCM